MRLKTTFTGYIGIILFACCLLPAGGLAQGNEQSSDLPMPARLVLTRINSLLQKKQYARAVEVLKAFQERGGSKPQSDTPDPKGYHHPEIYFALGNVYLQQAQYTQALAAYDQVIARNPGHTFAWLNRAKACYETKQFSEAGRSFSRGYDSAQKKRPEYLYHGAAAYLMADDPILAIKIFKQLMGSHSTDVKPLWKEHYVHALLAANRPKQALPIIRELAALFTGDKKIQWQEMLLYHYLQFDMNSQALKLSHQLTQQAPNEPRWWKAMAHIQLHVNRPEEALAALTIYSFLTPLSQKEKRLMADLSLQTGIPVKAAPLYEDCLKINPDKRLILSLAHAYRQLGMPEKALARLEAFKGTSQNAELLMLKGDLLYSLQRYDAAVRVFHQTARKNGEQAGRAWLMAGYAALQLNDFSGSKEAFGNAVRYKSHKKAAAKALQQLKQSMIQ